jgi:hypothetical protein
MGNGNPIGITGGNSISIEFHKGTFVEDPKNPDRHYCANKRITKVEVIDGDGNVTPVKIPDDGKCTINIHHG